MRRCNLSAYDAQKLIQRRLRAFEDDDMLVLRTQEGIPLYSNLVRGLTERFIYRNPWINLHHFVSPANIPYHDPYLYSHFYANFIPLDNSSDEFYEAPPDLQDNLFHGFPDDHSQKHTNPLSGFSNHSMYQHTLVRWEEKLSSPPLLGRIIHLSSPPLLGRIYGSDYPSQASVAPSSERVARERGEFDLNRPPIGPSEGPNVISSPQGSSWV